MPNPDFFRTVMGRQFYEGTMPALVRQLDRLNKNIERLCTVLVPQATITVLPDEEAIPTKPEDTLQGQG